MRKTDFLCGTLAKRLHGLALLVLFAAVSVTQAATTTTVRFTNNEVDLGNTTPVSLLGNEYQAFGLELTGVFRYIDPRDPFSDAPDQINLNPGVGNFGISNGDFQNPGPSGAQGQVKFLNGATSVTFDWWTLDSSILMVDTFDKNGVTVDSFSFPTGQPVPNTNGRSGTETITGKISYFTFKDNGGFVQIANLSYVVPLPAAGLVALPLLAGLLVIGKIRQHKLT